MRGFDSKEHDAQCQRDCQGAGKECRTEGGTKPGNPRHCTGTADATTPLQSAGNWWDVGSGTDEEAQTWPDLPGMRASGQEGSVGTRTPMHKLWPYRAARYCIGARRIELGIVRNPVPARSRPGTEPRHGLTALRNSILLRSNWLE